MYSAEQFLFWINYVTMEVEIEVLDELASCNIEYIKKIGGIHSERTKSERIQTL